MKATYPFSKELSMLGAAISEAEEVPVIQNDQSVTITRAAPKTVALFPVWEAEVCTEATTLLKTPAYPYKFKLKPDLRFEETKKDAGVYPLEML